MNHRSCKPAREDDQVDLRLANQRGSVRVRGSALAVVSLLATMGMIAVSLMALDLSRRVLFEQALPPAREPLPKSP